MKYPSQVAWSASTVADRQKQCRGEARGYSYSRDRDPIRDRLVNLLGSMQGATGGFAVASGMAALNLVCNALVPYQYQQEWRSLVIYGSGIHYECSERLRELGKRHGFDVLAVETCDLSQLRLVLENITNPERIALMWIEPIENPKLCVSNIGKVNDILKNIAPQALLVSDNTALPCFQHSLKWGADVEVISLAKYPSQGAVNGGLILTRNSKIEELLYDENSYLGAILGSQDALDIIDRFPDICHRLTKHCKNAETLAKLLQTHFAVKNVFYPTIFGSCKGADIETVTKQLGGMGGGIVTFELTGGMTAGDRLMYLTEALQETIFIQPTFGMPTTHLEHFATFLAADTIIAPGLCRLSVGLKHPDKIWKTLKRLLDQT